MNNTLERMRESMNNKKVATETNFEIIDSNFVIIKSDMVKVKAHLRII